MKNFTRAGLFAGAIALSTLGSASLHSSTQSIESNSYLLKVSNVVEAAQLVESIGGNVTETAASISYLGASLTDEQLQLLSRSDLVVRISVHKGASAEESFEAETGGVASNYWWWHRAHDEVASSIWFKRGGRKA